MFRLFVALGLVGLASADNTCTNFADKASCINQEVPNGQHSCSYCGDIMHHQGRECGIGCQVAQLSYGCSNSMFSGACIGGWEGDGLMPDDPHHHDWDRTAASLAPTAKNGASGPHPPVIWCLVAVVAVGVYVRRHRARRTTTWAASEERQALATSDDDSEAAAPSV